MYFWNNLLALIYIYVLGLLLSGRNTLISCLHTVALVFYSGWALFKWGRKKKSDPETNPTKCRTGSRQWGSRVTLRLGHWSFVHHSLLATSLQRVARKKFIKKIGLNILRPSPLCLWGCANKGCQPIVEVIIVTFRFDVKLISWNWMKINWCIELKQG